jgi:hypothetical protein
MAPLFRFEDTGFGLGVGEDVDGDSNRLVLVLECDFTFAAPIGTGVGDGAGEAGITARRATTARYCIAPHCSISTGNAGDASS